MKTIFQVALLYAAVLATGCATPHRMLVLDPVGPPPAAAISEQATGSLRVFSALARNADFNGLPYHKRYSDYTLLTETGETLRRIHNESGKLLGDPPTIDLAPGRYQVQARANGFGLVNVPVVVQPGRTTIVHLEGSVWWPETSDIFKANPVRLPNQEIVGWRATPRGGQTAKM